MKWSSQSLPHTVTEARAVQAVVMELGAGCVLKAVGMEEAGSYCFCFVAVVVVGRGLCLELGAGRSW